MSARETYLRAALYYSVAYHPLFGGPPVDDRLLAAFAQERSAFEKAAVHMDPKPEPIDVDVEGASMPGYFFRAGEGRRPLLVATNGYDASIYEMYLGHAVPARRRGYHCVVFDGPGQGAVLFEQGVPIRADWETVVRPVVDAVVERDDVDRARIALVGWSLGGYLAPRAARAEHRLAACIADPGLYSIPLGMIGRMREPGVPQEVIDRYPDIDEDDIAPFAAAVHANRTSRWAIEQRGFWVHGTDDLAGYLRAIAPFTLDGVASQIRCPMLITLAENDLLAASGTKTYDELTCPKVLVRFTAVEGADMHCEMQNRALYEQRVFDWLDRVTHVP